MAGLVEAADKSVTLGSSGTEWPVCAGQPSWKPGVQLTDDVRRWRKSSQFPSFGLAAEPVSVLASGLASPYCCMVLS